MLAAAEGQELVEGCWMRIAAEVDHSAEEYGFEVTVAVESQIAGWENPLQKDGEGPRGVHLERLPEIAVDPTALFVAETEGWDMRLDFEKVAERMVTAEGKQRSAAGTVSLVAEVDHSLQGN